MCQVHMDKISLRTSLENLHRELWSLGKERRDKYAQQIQLKIDLKSELRLLDEQIGVKQAEQKMLYKKLHKEMRETYSAYVYVPYEENEIAKSMGAKWGGQPNRNLWHVPDYLDLEPFTQKWGGPVWVLRKSKALQASPPAAPTPLPTAPDAPVQSQ
jgi:hypothetical protein